MIEACEQDVSQAISRVTKLSKSKLSVRLLARPGLISGELPAAADNTAMLPVTTFSRGDDTACGTSIYNRVRRQISARNSG